MAVLEITEHDDGTYEEIVYLNDDGEAVEMAEATRFILHIYDRDGVIVESFHGALVAQ